MKRKRGTANIEEAQLIRFAWWASFFATIALIAILGIARSAQAMTLPAANAPATTSAFIEPEDEEEFGAEEDEEEGEYWECEADNEAEEEECEAEHEAEEEAQAPRECVLTSATATVTTAVKSDKVRLVIRYTAYSPGPIQVAYFLRGKKGPLSFGSDRSQLGKQGVIRDTDTLTQAQMTKALAAKDFTILLRPANAPHYCNGLLDRHLTIRHNAAGRLTWSDPGPSSTASRQG